jgi:two-component system chemotaxis response regulator CheB
MATVLRCPVIAVGGSAGGVEALRAFCANLAPDLAAAVLVVLHQPATVRSELHAVLQAVTAVPVCVAVHRARPQPGHIYVSTPDRHLIVKDGVLQLTAGPRECHVRPAIDVLFRSVAVAMGPRCAGVVLSGLLDDGTAGLWSVKDHGGMALVQDPAEARYASMPLSAIQHVKVDVIARADALAVAVTEWAAQVAAGEAAQPAAVQPLHRLETDIAGGHSPGPQQLFELAAPSRFTCPECHGVLAEIREGSIVRFRCHTGHAYSLAVLLDRLNVTVEQELWRVSRAMEEKQMVLAWIRQHVPGGADPRGYAATTRAVHELRALAQAHAHAGPSANDAAEHADRAAAMAESAARPLSSGPRR